MLLTRRYGYGVEKQLNWAVAYIGYGLIAFGMTAIPSITMTYCMHIPGGITNVY